MKKILVFLSVILSTFLIVSIPVKAQEENDFNPMDWEQGQLLGSGKIESIEMVDDEMYYVVVDGNFGEYIDYYINEMKLGDKIFVNGLIYEVNQMYDNIVLGNDLTNNLKKVIQIAFLDGDFNKIHIVYTIGGGGYGYDFDYIDNRIGFLKDQGLNFDINKLKKRDKNKSLLFDKINEFIFNDLVNPFNESLKKYNINILDTPIKIYDVEYTIADVTGFTISITIITSLFIFAIRLFKSILGVFDL